MARRCSPFILPPGRSLTDGTVCIGCRYAELLLAAAHALERLSELHVYRNYRFNTRQYPRNTQLGEDHAIWAVRQVSREGVRRLGVCHDTSRGERACVHACSCECY